MPDVFLFTSQADLVRVTLIQGIMMNLSKIKLIISESYRMLADISSYIVWLGVAFLLIMVGGMTYEVIARYAIGKSTGIMDEVVSLLLVGIVVTGIGYTLRQGAHVRVGVVIQFFPQKVQAWLKLVTSIISLLSCIIATYYIGKESLNSYTYNIRSLSSLATPLYIPQALLCLGFAILTWELAMEAYAIVRSIYSQKRKVMNKLVP
jgi:TRAP-type C4-dicarboxylate transport system permease small subunit